jgi:hypothetical protein
MFQKTKVEGSIAFWRKNTFEIKEKFSRMALN